jgi:hypothetical protein
MSKQMTLGTGFEKYSMTTRREKFLSEMDRIMPWGELCALIAPVYPKAGDGCPPQELEMMLRVYFLQLLTKNKGKSRDPDMHQTKKGNHWDESPHRRGQPNQGHPRGGRHSGQCA